MAGSSGSDAGGPGATERGGAGGHGPAEGEGGAGGTPSLPFKGLYIGEDGDDEAAGTADAPFATLSHAASVAQSGDTIVFLDGRYDTTGPRIVIPDGVGLMAQNTGLATIVGTNGSLLDLAGDSRIQGLKFQSFANVVHFVDAAAASGNLELVDTTFTNCAVAIDLTGSVHASITTADGVVLGNGGTKLLVASGTSSATISGGLLQNYGPSGSFPGAIIQAEGSSVVEVVGLEVSDGGGRPFTTGNQAQLSIRETVVATLGQQLLVMRDTSSVSIESSNLSIKPAMVTPFECIRIETDSSTFLTLEDSKLHGCSTGINSYFPRELTLLRTEIFDMDVEGINLVGTGGMVRITDSKIHDVGRSSMWVNGALVDLKVRGTEMESGIGSASTAASAAVRITGSAAAVFDLGTLADPGQNTLLGSSATLTALHILVQTGTIQAVGNTWTPAAQGADAAGKYSVTGPGAKLDISGAVNTGQNYIKPYAAVTLRLAENQ
jgi:hypothetical protein